METRGCDHSKPLGGICFCSGDSDTGSPTPVQIFMSMACRIVLTAGENGDYVEKWCFVAGSLLYQIVLLCSLL